MNGMSDAITTRNQPEVEKSDEVLTPVGSTSYAHDKAKILARLRRMEGQVRGVQRMVEGDEYCLDVLTQLSAVIAAARGIGLLVLEDHVRGCVANALRAEDDETHQDEIMADLMGAIDRFGRSVG
jgi:DNA-binding FrmR family transcriptional regulator